MIRSDPTSFTAAAQDEKIVGGRVVQPPNARPYQAKKKEKNTM